MDLTLSKPHCFRQSIYLSVSPTGVAMELYFQCCLFGTVTWMVCFACLIAQSFEVLMDMCHCVCVCGLAQSALLLSFCDDVMRMISWQWNVLQCTLCRCFYRSSVYMYPSE